MKKTDVYVVVDTPKKAKKLNKVLDIFVEDIYSEPNNNNNPDHNGMGNSWRYGFSNGSWQGFNTKWAGHNGKIFKEVSIKELRNILAKEHLKANDVVVVKNNSGKWILKLTGNDISRFEHSASINLENNSFSDCKNSIRNGNFIRYATEEEKALLEPKKELEVGKWYKGNIDIESLIFITEIENVKYYNRIHGYGFKDGQWNDAGHLFSNTDHEKSLVEANYEEVKHALIEEANRLGHNYDKYSYDPDENNLCGYNGRLEEVFVDGVWNEPYDKLSNIKEEFNNGYCVEFYDEKTDTLKRHENPCWNPDLQWRIMVNNGHLVVSDVYLLNQIKELKKSIEEIKSNIK